MKEENVLNQEPNFYAVIPYNILTNEQIIPQARLLYGLLSSLCKYKGYCWASNKFLAEKFKTHKRTVGTWLNLLEKNHYISIDMVDNYKRKIFIVLAQKTIGEKCKGGRQKEQAPHRRKHQQNNISKYKDNRTIRVSQKTVTPSKCSKGILKGLKDKNTPDHKLAAKLCNYILKTKKTTHPLKISAWTTVFRDLKNKQDIDHKRLKTVILWYINHFNDKYTPKAYSAKTFREKFYNIEDAMLRVGPDLKPVDMTPEGTDLTKEMIDQYNWPKNSQKQLSQAIQISYNNLKVFVRKNNNWLEKNKKHKYFYYSQHLQYIFNMPKHYTRLWFMEVNYKVSRWKNWNGDLKPYILAEDNPMFIEKCHEISAEYCGNADRWEKFLELLNSQKSP